MKQVAYIGRPFGNDKNLQKVFVGIDTSKSRAFRIKSLYEQITMEMEAEINELRAENIELQNTNEKIITEKNAIRELYDETKSRYDYLISKFAHNGLYKPGYVAKMLDVTTRRLNQHLKEYGVIWKRCNAWTACKKYENKGYFEIKAVDTGKKYLNEYTNTFEPITCFQHMFTKKGIDWLIHEFLPEYPIK
jgi:phage antirepressor YoqD-like protein